MFEGDVALYLFMTGQAEVPLLSALECKVAGGTFFLGFRMTLDDIAGHDE